MLPDQNEAILGRAETSSQDVIERVEITPPSGTVERTRLKVFKEFFK
jgi:hypothetical protein